MISKMTQSETSDISTQNKQGGKNVFQQNLLASSIYMCIAASLISGSVKYYITRQVMHLPMIFKKL